MSLHPGTVNTEIGRYTTGCFACIWKCFSCCFKTPRDGAQTTIHCAVSPDIPNFSGRYFDNSRVQASNPQDAERLWNLSAKLVKLE